MTKKIIKKNRKELLKEEKNSSLMSLFKNKEKEKMLNKIERKEENTQIILDGLTPNLINDAYKAISPIGDSVVVTKLEDISRYNYCKSVYNQITEDRDSSMLGIYPRIDKIKYKGEEYTKFKCTLSSKVLGFNYYEGINYKNLKLVFNSMMLYCKHFFEEPDSITLNDFMVTAIHLKNDFPTNSSSKLLEKFANISNYNTTDYVLNIYNGQSLVLRNKLASPELVEHFTIYNKSKEWKKSRNYPLRVDFEINGCEIMKEFLRFELKLNSPQLINYYLMGAENKTDNTLHTLPEILAPKNIVNPVFKVFKQIYPNLKMTSLAYQDNWIQVAQNVGYSNWLKALAIAAFQIINGDDRSTCESACKNIYKRTTSISKKKRSHIVDSIPLNRPYTDEEYKRISEDLINRAINYLNLYPENATNPFQDVEDFLAYNGNPDSSCFYLHKPNNVKPIRWEVCNV